jgi:hypothetical protein
MSVRDRIEVACRGLGQALTRHARPVIAGMVLVVIAFGSRLPGLEFDTSTESFLHDDDPSRIVYDAFRAQYGRDERILVAIRPAGDVFDAVFLEKLRAFHEAVEDEVPMLVDVVSLVNARSTRGEGDTLVVEDLMEDWPTTDAERAALRERVFSNPLYVDQLVSRDGRLTTLVIETEAYSQAGQTADALAGFDDQTLAPSADGPWLTGEENGEIVRALLAVVARHRAPDFEIHVAGTPTMIEIMQLVMRRDMGRFTALAMLTIAGLLWLLFRRLAGVILPLVTVSMSIASTLSIMAISGTPLTMPTQILPSFLLAVGVGGSVHILVIFYQRRRAGEAKEEAIASAMGHSALAVMMASLTTAGGLVSFAAAEMAPIADFGIFGPVGVVLSLVFTIVLLPALVAVLPMRAEQPGETTAEPLSRRALVRVGAFATRHAGVILLATSGVLVLSVLGILRIGFSHAPVKWFKVTHPFRIANDLVNEELRGTMFLEVLVDTGMENGLHRPEILDRIETLQRTAEESTYRDLFIGKTMAVTDVLKEIHQALNENRPEFYAIPRDRELVAQELLLFENSGSDDLEDVVDSHFRQGRITLRAPFTDGVHYSPFLRLLEARFRGILGEDVDVTITGLMPIMVRTTNAVMHTLVKSYLIAFAVITPLMILLIGRVRIGLVSMVPNLAPIVITLGAMGWLGIRVDAFTMMVGSIAIGLAVDDTIHFLHNFRRAFERTGNVEEAVRETLRTTGQAMLFTTLVLSTGFFIYMLSEMNNLIGFGLLTGVTIILALVADIVLGPALMMLVARPRIAGEETATTTMEVAR